MSDWAVMEQWGQSILESDYEGWVAYVDDNPIYEAVPRLANAIPVMESARGVTYRAEGRRTMDWSELPHRRVDRVELYLREDNFDSPLVIRLDRDPMNDEMVFLQMKERGAVIQSGGETGPRRTGITAYRIGYYDPRKPQAMLWRITRQSHDLYGVKENPWAPRPQGWGLNPAAFGLEGIAS